MLPDPTYDKEEIRANPEWYLAFVLSEILNDGAPIGWSKYIGTAGCLLAEFEIRPKSAAPPTETTGETGP